MLYTSYLSKLKDLPDNMAKCLIVRFMPKGFNCNDYSNTYHLPQLSPSKQLLLRYKEDNNWSGYVEQFTKEMQNRADMVAMLERIDKALERGQNICLVCYERDNDKCHRSLLGAYFKSKGYGWKEL